jgi:hypothetical protein
VRALAPRVEIGLNYLNKENGINDAVKMYFSASRWFIIGGEGAPPGDNASPEIWLPDYSITGVEVFPDSSRDTWCTYSKKPK